MGIAFEQDEVWRFLAGAHTGILTTLRADGWPVPLPVWFVVRDRCVYVRAPEHTKKVGRIRRDPRAAFLVERGEAWAELQAVLLTGEVTRVEDDEVEAAVGAAFTAKYDRFRPESRRLPERTRQHYSSGTATLRLVPTEPPVSWDNTRLRLR